MKWHGISSRRFTGCGKTHSFVILSEAKNLSFFCFLVLTIKRDSSLRSEWQNKYLFRSLFCLWFFGPSWA